MVSEKEVEELRRRANTIFAHIDEIRTKLNGARKTEGPHWEGGLELELDAPDGETLALNFSMEDDPAEVAGELYDRGAELERELEEKRKVQGRLAEAPTDPLPYLVMNHLETAEGDYPRSMARNLGADRSEVVEACDDLQSYGLIERIESGMLKRKHVKLKRSDETHQHHTYYRLSRKGDHLLRHLDERQAKLNLIRRLDDALDIARRLHEGGPDYPRMTSEDLDIDLQRTRRLYRALATAGVVKKYDGSTIKASERKLKPKDETHRKHTYYVLTREADLALREME